MDRGKFENNTNPDVVFRLFDRAVYAEESQGYTIVLEHAPVKQTVIEPDMTLPAVDTQIPVPETTQIPSAGIRDICRGGSENPGQDLQNAEPVQVWQ